MRAVGFYHGRRSQQGFSLIELMIASVIGLLLLSAVLATFISSSRTFRLQESMSRVQESGRFALEALTRDIREAGYGLDDSESAIQGYADAATAREVDDVTDNVLAASREIRGEILYIPKYKVDSEENPRPDVAYFVANFVKKKGEPSEFTLYRNDEPLVEGVESIAFEYGVDADGNRQVDGFVTAADVADWSKIVAVRLNVLVTGIDTGVVDQPQQKLPDPFSAVSTADRRLYQVYTSTVALRNRLP